jgi:hypothetical protein
MGKLPYFPLTPIELLYEDDKTPDLTNEELGIVVRLWSLMWINKIKRGHLLVQVNGAKSPLPESKILSILHLTPEIWAIHRQNLVGKDKILKVGKFKEIYSERLANYKTEWELRQERTQSERKPNAERTHLNIIRIRRGIELELEVEEEYFGDLIQTFPGIDHEQELLNADAWHKSQPKEKKKKNHHAFLRNWFQKSYQDKQKGNQNAREQRSGQTKRIAPSRPEEFGTEVRVAEIPRRDSL